MRVLGNTDKVVNYVLPPNPNAELSDSELEAVAGGKVSDSGNYIPGTGERPGSLKCWDDLRKGNVLSL